MPVIPVFQVEVKIYLLLAVVHTCLNIDATVVATVKTSLIIAGAS